MSESLVNTVEQASPFQNLNHQFDNQNERLGLLIQRLRNKLHNLSDTNFPTAALEQSCKVSEDLPFHDGYLKTYHNYLKSNEELITQLLIQVEKVESLI